MTSQQLCNASCFEKIARSNASAEDLKQPLLVVVEDLESSPSSQEQEQNTDDARQRVSTLILTKTFWIGAFAGLLLQLVTRSAFLVLFLRSGKNHNIVCLPHCPTGLFTCSFTWIFLSTLSFGRAFSWHSRKGSVYLRKKFDSDADAPSSESVWTPRFLVLNGTDFLLGFTTASYVVLAIADITLGTHVPLVSLISAFLVEVGLCCLLIKCFDWGHQPDDEPEEDQEDSYFN